MLFSGTLPFRDSWAFPDEVYSLDFFQSGRQPVQLKPVPAAKFLGDVGQLVFDGLLAHFERRGDLFGPLPRGQMAEHLDLTPGQLHPERQAQHEVCQGGGPPGHPRAAR